MKYKARELGLDIRGSGLDYYSSSSSGEGSFHTNFMSKVSCSMLLEYLLSRHQFQAHHRDITSKVIQLRNRTTNRTNHLINRIKTTCNSTRSRNSILDLFLNNLIRNIRNSSKCKDKDRINPIKPNSCSSCDVLQIEEPVHYFPSSFLLQESITALIHGKRISTIYSVNMRSLFDSAGITYLVGVLVFIFK